MYNSIEFNKKRNRYAHRRVGYKLTNREWNVKYKLTNREWNVKYKLTIKYNKENTLFAETSKGVLAIISVLTFLCADLWLLKISDFEKKFTLEAQRCFSDYFNNQELTNAFDKAGGLHIHPKAYGYDLNKLLAATCLKFLELVEMGASTDDDLKYLEQLISALDNKRLLNVEANLLSQVLEEYFGELQNVQGERRARIEELQMEISKHAVAIDKLLEISQHAAAIDKLENDQKQIEALVSLLNSRKHDEDVSGVSDLTDPKSLIAPRVLQQGSQQSQADYARSSFRSS